MLTKNDLEQIKEVLHEEFRVMVREEVRPIIREEVRPIIREEVSIQLKPVQRTLAKIQKELKFIVNDYSNAISEVRNRVIKIEQYLKLSDS